MVSNPTDSDEKDPNGIRDGDDDADGDGLTNAYESIIGTEFDIPDSDGDGVDDGDELSSGADPANPDDGGQPEEPTETEQATITISTGIDGSKDVARFSVSVEDGDGSRPAPLPHELTSKRMSSNSKHQPSTS